MNKFDFEPEIPAKQHDVVISGNHIGDIYMYILMKRYFGVKGHGMMQKKLVIK